MFRYLQHPKRKCIPDCRKRAEIGCASSLAERDCSHRRVYLDDHRCPGDDGNRRGSGRSRVVIIPGEHFWPRRFVLVDGLRIPERIVGRRPAGGCHVQYRFGYQQPGRSGDG